MKLAALTVALRDSSNDVAIQPGWIRNLLAKGKETSSYHSLG